MAGVSTGVSLLTSSNLSKFGSRLFLEMSESSNYINSVTNLTATSGAANSQSTTGTVSSNLNQYHLFNNGANNQLRSITGSQVFPEFSLVNTNLNISFWFKPNSSGLMGGSSGTGERLIICGTGSSSASSFVGIGIHADGSGLPMVAFYNGASALTLTPTLKRYQTGWHFYSFNFTLNGGLYYDVASFIDGVSFDTTFTTGSRFAQSTGWIFCSTAGVVGAWSGQPTDAGVDNLSISDRILTPTEISLMYNSGTGRNYSQL
jgi:hypothetical protein